MTDESGMTSEHAARGSSSRLPFIALMLAGAACVAGGIGIGLAVLQKRAAGEIGIRLGERELELVALSNRVDRLVATVDGMEKLAQAGDAKQRALLTLSATFEKQAAALSEAIAREQRTREEFEEPARKSFAALHSRIVELDDRIAATRRETGAANSAPDGIVPREPATVSNGEYTIQSGDTLEKVAKKHRVGIAAILQLNPGVDPTRLRIGQKIRLPESGDTSE
jgi:LysM repeat protein